jgi:hypothetical protein
VSSRLDERRTLEVIYVDSKIGKFHLSRACAGAIIRRIYAFRREACYGSLTPRYHHIGCLQCGPTPKHPVPWPSIPDSVQEALLKRQINWARAAVFSTNSRIRYRRRPQTSSLLPWKCGRKLDESLLGDEREALLRECIVEFYLRPERPSLAALQLEVRRRERHSVFDRCRN